MNVSEEEIRIGKLYEVIDAALEVQAELLSLGLLLSRLGVPRGGRDLHRLAESVGILLQDIESDLKEINKEVGR